MTLAGKKFKNDLGKTRSIFSHTPDWDYFFYQCEIILSPIPVPAHVEK